MRVSRRNGDGGSSARRHDRGCRLQPCRRPPSHRNRVCSLPCNVLRGPFQPAFPAFTTFDRTGTLECNKYICPKTLQVHYRRGTMTFPNRLEHVKRAAHSKGLVTAEEDHRGWGILPHGGEVGHEDELRRLPALRGAHTGPARARGGTPQVLQGRV